MDTLASPVVSISPDALLNLISQRDAPLILDVRPQHRFAASDTVIASALRCAPEDVEAFAKSNPARQVVTYCVYGHGVSQNAAAMLKRHGWDASFLAGGFAGGEDGVDAPADIMSWRACRLPMTLKTGAGEGAKP